MTPQPPKFIGAVRTLDEPYRVVFVSAIESGELHGVADDGTAAIYSRHEVALASDVMKPSLRLQTVLGRPVSERLVPIDEVAALLAVSRSTVYNLMDSGDLPSFKIGGARRIKLTDVQSLINKGLSVGKESE